MNAMTEKQGYKFTEEFGYIPEDWNVKKLDEVASIKDGTHQTPKYVNVGVPFYSVENITNNDFVNTKYISESEHEKLTSKYKIEYGDVLMTRIGSIGDCKYIDWYPNASFYVSLALLKIKKNYSPRYITQFSKTAIFRQELDNNSLPFAIPKKINLGAISNVRIIIPNSIDEQEKIAEVLGDIDSLIDKTQQLINKKKDIKTATMQKLLTPKEDWASKKLGEICSYITTGKLDANAMVENGEYRFYTCAREYYHIDTYAFEGESLLVSGNGANVGYIHYYNGKFNAYQRTYVLQKFSENIFYIKCFMDKYLSDRIASEVNAGNTPYIKLDTITDMIIRYPTDKREQERMAAIISDMDGEIEVLEKELSKYRDLKTGVMQQLLTGKVRLI